MKKIILIVLMCLVCSVAQAQCVATVKDVIQDPIRGSIVVETEYKLNGTVVNVQALPEVGAIGRTRYLETSGTIQEIVAKAKADIQQHCGNLIIRNAVRINNLNGTKLQIQKDLTTPMIATIKANAVGWTKTLTQKFIQYKGKDITIEADGTYTVINTP